MKEKKPKGTKKTKATVSDVAKSVDVIAKHLVTMEIGMRKEFDEIGQDIHGMEIKLDNIDSRLIRVEGKVNEISASVEEIDERLNNIENRFDDVEKDTRTLKKAVFK